MVIKIFLYICIWIVGIDPPMKVDSRTPLPDTFVWDNLKSETMKTIQLTQGQFALVDDEDYDFLMQWKWQAHKDKSTYYATRVEYGKNIKKGIKMHRVIMNTPRNMETDHKDRNGLNNQKYNLRICTRGQNQTNKRNWGKSKNKGVNLAPCIRPSGKICPRITAQINI